MEILNEYGAQIAFSIILAGLLLAIFFIITGENKSYYREEKTINTNSNYLTLKIAGGIIIGGFVLFLIIMKVLDIAAGELAKELEKENERILEKARLDEEKAMRTLNEQAIQFKKQQELLLKPFKDAENRRKGIFASEIGIPKLKNDQCKPAKINGVWQQHCE